MAGNYFEDANVDGWYCTTSTTKEWAWGFRCTHFAWMDTFVYFSHKLVCVPPAGWTAAAHRHGTHVLGVLMTEFESGEAQCAELFDTQQSALRVAERLNAMRQAHGFDGWLINIENKLTLNQVSNVLAFLQALSASNARVIWYDSVVSTTGELRWQNALNECNVEFFSRANGGILTNYGWSEERAACSSAFAAQMNRVEQVWHGIDVFGRGTLGGGGFHCNVALDALERGDARAACLFAPGWALESAAERNASLGRRKQLEFWDKMLKNSTSWGYASPGTHPAPVLELTKRAFYTDFCDGGGEKLCARGKLLFNSAWLDMRRQTVQPRWDVISLEEDEETEAAGVTIHAVDSLPLFSGSCALQITGPAQPGGGCFLPILSVNARLSQGEARTPLRVRAAFHCTRGDVALSLTLCPAEGGFSPPTRLVLTRTGGGNEVRGLAANRTERCRAGWLLRTWDVDPQELMGKRITEVGVSPLRTSSSSSVDVRIGMVSLDETMVDTTGCVPCALFFHEATKILTWKCTCASSTTRSSCCSLLFVHVFIGRSWATCAFGNECSLPNFNPRTQTLHLRAMRWDGSQSAKVVLL